MLRVLYCIAKSHKVHVKSSDCLLPIKVRDFFLPLLLVFFFDIKITFFPCAQTSFYAICFRSISPLFFSSVWYMTLAVCFPSESSHKKITLLFYSLIYLHFKLYKEGNFHINMLSSFVVFVLYASRLLCASYFLSRENISSLGHELFFRWQNSFIYLLWLYLTRFMKI